MPGTVPGLLSHFPLPLALLGTQTQTGWMENNGLLALPPWEWRGLWGRGLCWKEDEVNYSPSLRGLHCSLGLGWVGRVTQSTFRWDREASPLNRDSWGWVLMYSLDWTTVHVKVQFPWWCGSHLGFPSLSASWCDYEVGTVQTWGQGTVKACPWIWAHRSSSACGWTVKTNEAAE